MFESSDIFVYFIFPIIQLIVINALSDRINCEDSFIKISAWINIDIFLTMLTGINLYYYITQNRKNFCENITTVLYYVLGFFNILWFILGVIDIFHNCIGYERDDVKFYLTFTLGIFTLLIYKIFIVKKRERRALLDIEDPIIV